MTKTLEIGQQTTWSRTGGHGLMNVVIVKLTPSGWYRVRDLATGKMYTATRTGLANFG